MIHEAIFNWVKGAGLRPVLSVMNETDQARFSQIYINQLKQKYISQENGKVLLPFRRMFMVGFKSAKETLKHPLNV